MKALWRISRYSDLKGLGGETDSGRWHTAASGTRIVYLAEHPALALVEVLANVYGRTGFMPNSYQLIRIALTDRLSTELLPEASLSNRWRDNLMETRFIGDSWLAEGRSALLGVPSAPSPESTNYLFNPLHADARHLAVEWCRWIEYDRRLFQTHN